MAVISVRVEKSGRILIPSAVRRRLGLKEGESDLLLEIDETPVRAMTRAQALRRVQKWASSLAPGRNLSEELLDDRRQEASKDRDE